MTIPLKITGKTSVCGVIGDPVEHTVSPAMHNAAFSELGLDFIYLPFKVAAGTWQTLCGACVPSTSGA